MEARRSVADGRKKFEEEPGMAVQSSKGKEKDLPGAGNDLNPLPKDETTLDDDIGSSVNSDRRPAGRRQDIEMQEVNEKC